MNKVKEWFRSYRKNLLRLVVLLVLAGLIAGGYCYIKRDSIMPDMNGKGYKVFVSDGEAYCTLGRKNDNLLLRLNPEGELLSCYRTPRDTFIEEFKVYGNEIYAILTERTGSRYGITQSLVRFTVDRKILKPEVITRFDSSDTVRWKSLALEEPETILLAGFNEGKICTAEFFDGKLENRMEEIWAGVEDTSVDRIVRDEFGEVAWIHMGQSGEGSEYGQLNQFRGGKLKLDVAADSLTAPNRMVFFSGELFVSDSATGDVYMVDLNNPPQFFRSGNEVVGTDQSGPKMNLANFAIYGAPDHNLKMVGLWSDGASARIAGDGWDVSAVTAGNCIPQFFWQTFWPAALAALVLLLVLTGVLDQVTSGRRLALRLLLCEAVAALAMLSALTAMQFRFYVDITNEESQEQLRLLGGSMAIGLTSDSAMTDQQLSGKIQLLQTELLYGVPEEEQQDYKTQVIWKNGEGEYTIGYDGYYPIGYRVRDMEDQSYQNMVALAISTQTRNMSHTIQRKDSTTYQSFHYFTQGSREGCVVMRQKVDVKQAVLERMSWQFPLSLAIYALAFLILLLVTRKLLSPLDRIQKALEEFYTEGGGNQIRLKGIPHTELYEISRVFNQLSRDTRVQKNELEAVNRVYARMVPDSMMKLLGITGAGELKPGMVVKITGNMLVIAAKDPEGRQRLNREIVCYIVETVGESGGLMVDSDEELRAMTALFPTREQAVECGHKFLDNGLPVLPTVLEEPVEFGVFGGEHLLYPAALTTRMARRMEVIDRLRSFGVDMIRSGSGNAGQRLLGWDDDVEFYEEVSCHTPEWKSAWREAEPLWQKGMELYRIGSYKLAARMFAKVLRLMPEDIAARWYLFRCAKLRVVAEGKADCGLLAEEDEVQ